MSLGVESFPVQNVESVRDEFPAIVGDPGKNYIFADAPTGTQVHPETKLFVFVYQTRINESQIIIITFN